MGFLQTIGEGYKIMGNEAKRKIADNRANIWTGVSVIGTVGTAIASWFGGMKSARVIDAESAKLQRDLTMKEKAKLCWTHTLVPAGTVIVSGAGAITSNRIQAGDIARLTSDVVIATKAYNELKKATSEVVSEKQQMAIKDKIAEKDIQELTPDKVDRLDPPVDGSLPQIFKEHFSGIVFISSVDKITLGMQKLQYEMKLLKPRNKFYTSKRHGVPYSMWVDYIKKLDPSAELIDKDTIIYKDYGWNKGYWCGDRDDDDEISFYLTPGECRYRGELRSCYDINWDQDPSDMNLGDVLKSCGVD